VFDVPYPSRSTTPGAPTTTEPGAGARGVVAFESASVPVVPLGVRETLASGSGRSTPVVPLPGIATRKYPPAAIVPVRAAAEKVPAPVAGRYCNDQPANDTDDDVGL
jgi:hypothetical protein